MKDPTIIGSLNILYLYYTNVPDIDWLCALWLVNQLARLDRREQTAVKEGTIHRAVTKVEHFELHLST